MGSIPVSQKPMSLAKKNHFRASFSRRSVDNSSNSIPRRDFGDMGLLSFGVGEMGVGRFGSPVCLNRGFGDVGRLVSGFDKLGCERFVCRAVSGGGDGGSGGFGGGGGGDGDGGSESGGDDESIFSWYLTALDKHPVLTKSVTSSFLNCIGDLICQILIDRVPTLDVKRTFVFSLLGFVLVGPTLHFWYFYLSQVVTLNGASGAFVRLLLDQFIFSPIFIGAFLSSLVTLEGKPSQVLPKLQQDWWSSVLANWQLWIPFQFLNFRFVPQQFQVLAANFVALAWNVILSFKAHKALETK
ncbi:hypothetical protein QJS10_CPB04g00545 [Acorus calamus]|uniref:Uncharacterized protein n=1 Tax=Acorus calamus TaxID=4465 RepID=A0AAV9F2M6_ACOCL|nr:hypothetical protein QJS10_CPB04g00545 [Acorus calamus]